MSAAPAQDPGALRVRHFGRVDYAGTWQAMRSFTDTRGTQTPDELWLVEHPPVYTMGLRGRNGAIHDIQGIPVVYSDRGGDMTYHGPGQVVLYAMLDLNRLGLGIRALVQTLEQTVLDYLGCHGLAAQRRAGAPGVYVGERKIAALGLRVRSARSYHGLAFNNDMDLAPFAHIDPCGYRELPVACLRDFGIAVSDAAVGEALSGKFAALLGYTTQVRTYPTEPTAAPLNHG